MRCAIGCSESIAPAIGVANLEGVKGTPVEGYSGQYPLCYHHINEIRAEKWINVRLLGWEEFPDKLVNPTPVHLIGVSKSPEGRLHLEVAGSEPDPEII